MIYPPDASLVLVFSWFKTVIGVFSIVLALISTLLVLFCSGRTSPEYRYCLIVIVVSEYETSIKYKYVIQISAAISDVNLHYLFAPIPILPSPCLYTNGLLDIIGVSSGTSFVCNPLL